MRSSQEAAAAEAPPFETPNHETVEEASEEMARARLELLVDMEQRSPAPPPKLVYGTVGNGERLSVVLPEGARLAQRAKSCLVAAEPGDRVLCSTDGDMVFILAVLESAGAGSSSTTRVVADGELEIAASALKIRAKTAHVTLQDLKLFGRSVEATLTDKVSVVAERIESRASRLLVRAKQAFRFVDDLDQVRAGNFDVRAESLAAVRGENTIVAARVLTKIDGEQVKIG